MGIISQIEKNAAESGFSQYGYVEIGNLKFHQEIRTICQGNSCRNYATSWACPPTVGTIEECKRRVEQHEKMMLFSNEGCGRCSVCTYPDAPCRFPQFLHHSLEGYGFIVRDLAKEANMQYTNGANTVTYFGALLFS